jgi:hypothetical protein
MDVGKSTKMGGKPVDVDICFESPRYASFAPC